MTRSAFLPVPLCLLAIACATPVVTPVDVRPVVPGPGESVDVDQSILIIDSSGSISRREQFPSEKAMVRSLVSAMPEGKYDAGAIVFGGVKRETHPLSSFNRQSLGTYAGDLPYLNEATPLEQVLNEAGAALAGKSNRAAVTIVSDGMPTDLAGREMPDERVLEAANNIAKNYRGTVCFHTIQVGNEEAGTALMQKLAKTTSCGSYRTASSLSSASALQTFQRQVYVAAAPVVAAVDGDADGDGVPDSRDKCPNTPKLARVDERGCWVIANLHFTTNSAEVEEGDKELLKSRGVAILDANPDLRVRIDGHTDSRGTDAYNMKLSERRADAVRKVFIEDGIDPSRLETRGFGEAEPVAPNDSPENMALNRRVEFTPIVSDVERPTSVPR